MGTWGTLRVGEVEESPRKERKSLKLLLPCIAMSKLLGISIADYKILWSPDLNTHKCLVLKLYACGDEIGNLNGVEDVLSYFLKTNCSLVIGSVHFSTYTKNYHFSLLPFLLHILKT